MSCSLGWPQINYVDKDDLELPDLPASSFQALGLQTRTTLPLACFCFLFFLSLFLLRKDVSVAQVGP